MGAWPFAQARLEELLGGRQSLSYAGRERSSSPAEGSTAWYAANQKALIEQAFREGAKTERQRS